MLFWLNLQHDHSSPEWTVEYKFKQSSTSLKRQFTQTCMNVFVLNTKEDILKNVGNRAVFLVPQNSLITNFLQNIFLCVQNKHIHTGWLVGLVLFKV